MSRLRLHTPESAPEASRPYLQRVAGQQWLPAESGRVARQRAYRA